MENYLAEARRRFEAEGAARRRERAEQAEAEERRKREIYLNGGYLECTNRGELDLIFKQISQRRIRRAISKPGGMGLQLSRSLKFKIFRLRGPGDGGDQLPVPHLHRHRGAISCEQGQAVPRGVRGGQLQVLRRGGRPIFI